MKLHIQIASVAVALFLPTYTAAETPRAEGVEIRLSRPEWVLWAPKGLGPSSEGRVSLLVHFHGDPPTVRRNVAQAGLKVAVVTVNYRGLSSAYRRPFEEASLFSTLLDDALAHLVELPGFENVIEWDRVAVSSFSAGYGAVRELLKTPAYFDRIDALLAADSIYASTAADGTPEDSQMAGFKRYAERAAAGDKQFVVTHSGVPTPGYESTAETGDELLEHLGLTAQPTEVKGPGPLRYYRAAERGGFTFWGARGDDGEAHMQHLRYMAEWLDDLGLPTRESSQPAGTDG